MLQNSDRSIPRTIEMLSRYEIEASFLVPTETGLEKSILDAHGALRTYLKLNNLHDYSLQCKGSNFKKNVDGFYISPHGNVSTQVSLYRPETKNGDPRIWPYRLKQFANQNNLLAVFVNCGNLYIANVSDPKIMSPDYEPSDCFVKFLNGIIENRRSIANELLDEIKYCTKGQWIASKRKGPTGVGFTLETLLGITANNRQAPDYKGIEIKTGRTANKTHKSRATLFSKTPNWIKSTCKSGTMLLENYGYEVDGRKQLYCSLNNIPNTLGHFFEIADQETTLQSMYVRKENAVLEKVFHWDIDVLTSSLATKHRETFWVKAQVRKNGDVEEFRYSTITHTKSPFLTNMVEVLKTGGIELDYCLHEEVSSKGHRRARDHGYLFKIWPKNLTLIFPPAATYELI